MIAKPKEFDPEAKLPEPYGLARKRQIERERLVAEAQYLRDHFKLGDKGMLPEEDNSTRLSSKMRRERNEALTAFPVMPDHELQKMQRLIGTYGLPLTRLDSDTAAFILRRVMFDYFKLTVLRRRAREPLFTAEELLELMRVLQVTPFQLAQIVQPKDNRAVVAAIDRWLHKVGHPTGVTAMKINRMIEQQVRRKSNGGFPRPRKEEELSQKPSTVKRRNLWRKQHGVYGNLDTSIPISKAAQEAIDAAIEDALDERMRGKAADAKTNDSE